MSENILYYGDNLDILRQYVQDETVDLIYLDPPFKSNQDYNILFAEKNGSQSAAQIRAFEDTWQWDRAAAQAYEQVVEAGGRAAEAMIAFRKYLGGNDMLAYLSMMAPRLKELRRVLKPTGSIYLHCDPTASHYLKILMDAVFGPVNFRNEIVWKRSHAHSSARKYGPNHDTIFFYTKERDFIWNTVFQDYDPEYLAKHYRHVDEDGRRYKHENPTGAGIRHGETGKPWRGIDPTSKGRHWVKIPLELEELDRKGKIYWPKKEKAWPYIKIYLDEMTGIPAQDLWADIGVINMMAKERLGYPTQKPEALLERIIRASSSKGDVVLDPFCGCGTTINVAQKLKRNWIGIDITHIAIALIKYRLHNTFGNKVRYKIVGVPVSLPDAENLAKSDPYQFQAWAVGHFVGFPHELKRGADKGIDGRLYFHDDPSRKTKQIVFSVKAGKVGVAHVRDLRGVIDREKAEIGVLIALQEPTKPMREEAASAGYYESRWGKHPRLQILTVAELLEGKGIDCPPQEQVNVTFKKAPKAKSAGDADKQRNLIED